MISSTFATSVTFAPPSFHHRSAVDCDVCSSSPFRSPSLSPSQFQSQHLQQSHRQLQVRLGSLKGVAPLTRSQMKAQSFETPP